MYVYIYVCVYDLNDLYDLYDLYDMYVCMNECMYVYVCMYMYMYMYVCMYMYAQRLGSAQALQRIYVPFTNK